MRITVETSVEHAVAERFLALYRESFAPLEDKAVARQSLTDDEFREEMEDTTVLKFVTWEGGRPCAMAIVSTDLSVVPWISPRFFESRFPEHYKRGVVFYFGALLVEPNKRGGIWSAELLKELVAFVVRNRGIAAFDCCQYNASVIDLPGLVAAVTGSMAEFEQLEIDAQRYYAYVAGTPLEGIDLDLPAAMEAERKLADRVDIDLVAIEAREAREVTEPAEEEARERS